MSFTVQMRLRLMRIAFDKEAEDSKGLLNQWVCRNYIKKTQRRANV